MTTTERIRIGSPRTTYVSLWIVAALGFTGLLLLGRQLAAVGVFALAALAAVAYQRVGDVRFDERDDEVLRTAGANTIGTVGIASAVVFPSLVVANALGYYEWTPFMAGVGVTIAAIYLLWLGTLLVARANR
ncbi:hypothetical protein [Halorientalis marina]|jgi:uncharacterized membrane protein|uniref:hypothetical protein n=1 Tax=Halorientalis marina TaxID=2931976 RepID=UPI001FF252A6|nr:hypothetical protein [Halorientalis marina]